MSRFLKTGEFEVDAVRYRWALHRYGGASSMYENHRGLSILVGIPGQRGRELIVDFPFRDYRFGRPKSNSEFEARLRRCVRGSRAMGWDPEARGKPFRIDASQAEKSAFLAGSIPTAAASSAPPPTSHRP